MRGVNVIGQIVSEHVSLPALTARVPLVLVSGPDVIPQGIGRGVDFVALRARVGSPAVNDRHVPGLDTARMFSFGEIENS